MKQTITIDALNIPYVIEEKHIRSVMGYGYIYRTLTFRDVTDIIHRGLLNTCGYTADEFHQAILKGHIYASKKRGQYPFSIIRQRIQARIRNVNRNYTVQSSTL